MKSIISTMLLGCALLMSSCSITHRTATTVNVGSKITQYPLVADLEVMEKAEATISWNCFTLDRPRTVREAKGNVISQILSVKDADILLEPQTVVTTKMFGRTTVTVKGYPAKFKNFRNATDKDIEAIKTCLPLPENERTIY